MVLFTIDVCSAQGISKPKSQTEFYSVKKKAEQGNANAQCILGKCYMTGTYVAQDTSKGVYWYKKAANQGNAEGQAQLGMCYLMGTGVQADYQKGLDLIESAAKKGNKTALKVVQALMNSSN